MNIVLNRHQRLFVGLALGVMFIVTMATPAQAEADSPKQVLEATAQEMFDAINNNRNRIKADPNITTQLIEEILLPHLDFITASKYVLGSNWDSATRQQKIGFIKAFRTLLLRFYSSALTEYLNSHDDKLDTGLMVFFDPGTATNGQVIVRSRVSPKTGKPVPINYQMHKTRKGWKVYDVSVEGVSMITTYKTSFASEIKQSGLDALIKSLEERNAKLLAGDTSALKTNGKQ
jgi:phospholipid transport system substrate-binding protein